MKLKLFVCAAVFMVCMLASNAFELGQPVVDSSLAFEQVTNPSTANSTLLRNSNSLDVKPYIYGGFAIFVLIVFAKEAKSALTSLKESL